LCARGTHETYGKGSIRHLGGYSDIYHPQSVRS